MAEFIKILSDIKMLPVELHLLCPRQNDLDSDRYDEDEVQNENGVKDEARTKLHLERIAEAKSRRKRFISSLQLQAYDGKESEEWQAYIWNLLERTLTRCDVCIREYHIAKLGFMAKLRQEYDEAEVKEFFAIIDRRDVNRIKVGLNAAARALRDLPESKRSINALEPAELHAIFEALICEGFLNNQPLVEDYFDEPFALIRSRKPLKIREYLPAVTRFLFSPDPRYQQWAISIWKGIDRPPTPLEWSWAIKDTLQRKLRDVNSPTAMLILWSGFSVIVERLSCDQIAQNLCDLVPNVCTTALNHLSKQSFALPWILKTIRIILEKAPTAFWEAMGSISASTIAEQVFANPFFDKLLQDTTSGKEEDVSAIDLLFWMAPFLASINSTNRPSACRTLATQLSNRVRSPHMSPDAKGACYESMVKVLQQTIMPFAEDEAVRKGVTRVVLSDTLDTISENIDLVMGSESLQISASRREKVEPNSRIVVKNSLALECQNLKTDFESLSKQEVTQAENSSYSPGIWNAVGRKLGKGDVKLAEAAVRGIMALPGLEQFSAKNPNDLSKGKQAYNVIFHKLTGMVSEILELLCDFPPDSLDILYKDQTTSMSLIAALFSADTRTYQAAVDLVKKISGESGREEALAHLLKAFLSNAVYGICWTFRRIYQMKTFSPITRMLKSGMELLNVLCNTQTGILRSQSLADRDYSAIQSYWSYQWMGLNGIFQQTEAWSNEVHDKALMTEVCRDAMQYAEALFEQYDVFASALSTVRPSKARDIPGILLDSTGAKWMSPAKTLRDMAKWLRLRDQYLVDTLVKLLTKMLGRLSDYDSHVDREGLRYIQEVATRSSVRTNLSEAQKATLIRALEFYTKEVIAPVMRTKQSKLQNWVGSSTSDRSGASTPVSRDRNRTEFGDPDSADEDVYELPGRALEMQKTIARDRDKQRATSNLLKPKSQVSMSIAKRESDKAFIENRRRETEARKLRDKEAAAKLRGSIGVGEQTKGQGSGLKGIGVKGKDHASGQNSMMVSSDSESDSDSSQDELDQQLFGNKVKSTSSRPGASVKVPNGPVKKIKQLRSQKDIRARLAPDLSSLHKTILSWDFFADTDLPPNSEKDDYTLVTSTFKTPVDYQRTFEPLLVLEGWQSFRSAREDGNFRIFELKVSSQMLVDSFVELITTMSWNDGKEIGIGSADIVLLSKGAKPTNEPDQPHCLARVKQINRKKGDMEIIYRVNAGGNLLRPFLNEGSKVCGSQILSMTPLEREYGALMALPYYDLCEEIVRAKPSPLLEYPQSELQGIMKAYSVNSAQAKAVRSGLDNDGFTLIQGPPGSGKSSTICALIGAMMTSTLKWQGRQAHRPTSISDKRADATLASIDRKKILVCAPSNAAVDELVMRLKAGVKAMDGATHDLAVVRLGRSDAINAGVKDVTLEELVNARLSTAAPKNPAEDIYAVMTEHKETSVQVNTLRDQISETRGRGQAVTSKDESDLERLRQKQRQLSGKIDSLREKQKTAARDAELNRKRMQQLILDSAHVLCATLSGSGHEIFQGLNVEFETVIIDEAAQSIELSALIPLKYGCSKCILVGDPKQLPPTVLSREAAKFQYEQSLFARMEKNHTKDVHLLDTQYRMHPEISLYPSKTFYDSRLKDGADMAKLRARSWHHSKLLGPYMFYDVQGMSSAASKGHSLVNVNEINVAMQLYDRLIADVRKVDFTGKVGIITPYKGQLRELKAKFVGRHGQDILSKIEFNTTDAFQGRECDIIIFSCVRANTKGIGFLNDIRRMNVGLTRAKCSLWVLGNTAALSQGEFWRGLITDAKSRNLYTDGDILNLLKRPLLTDDMMKDDIDMVDTETQPALTSHDFSSIRPSLATIQSSSGSKMELTSRLPLQDSRRSSSSQSVTSVSRNPSSASVTRRPAALRQPSGPDPQPRSGVNEENSKVPQAQVSQPITDQFSRRALNQWNGGGPDGPSGGQNGLNMRDVCNICGSEAHFSFACDNVAAREASVGLCGRCNTPGHTRYSCPQLRCMECGELGHGTETCSTPANLRLSAEEREVVQKQEAEYERGKKRNREKRAAKQLAEHGATIPRVRSTAPVSSAVPPPLHEGKRKREEQPPVNTPRGPKTMKASSSIPTKTTGQLAADNASGPSLPTNQARRSPESGGRLPPPPPLRPQGLGGAGPGRPALMTPMVKKKKRKNDDMFIKKR